MAEDLEDVPTMTLFDVCVLYDALPRWFSCKSREPRSGIESCDLRRGRHHLEVGSVFESVGCDEGLCSGGEALDDGGGDGDFDGVPG